MVEQYEEKKIKRELEREMSLFIPFILQYFFLSWIHVGLKCVTSVVKNVVLVLGTHSYDNIYDPQMQ